MVKRLKLGKISNSPLAYGIKCSRPGVDVETGNSNNEEEINFTTEWPNILRVSQVGQGFISSGWNDTGDRIYYTPAAPGIPNMFEFRMFDSGPPPTLHHDLRNRQSDGDIRHTRYYIAPGFEAGGAAFLQGFVNWNGSLSYVYFGNDGVPFKYVIFDSSANGPIV